MNNFDLVPTFYVGMPSRTLCVQCYMRRGSVFVCIPTRRDCVKTLINIIELNQADSNEKPLKGTGTRDKEILSRSIGIPKNRGVPPGGTQDDDSLSV